MTCLGLLLTAGPPPAVEPEPLADFLADSGFDVLVEQRGVSQDVFFAQVALKEKHF